MVSTYIVMSNFLDILRRNYRPIVMILTMCFGVLLHRPLTLLDSAANHQLAPAFIFAMLYVTFCRVKVSELRFSMMHVWLLLFQVAASIAVYHLLLPVDGIIAQGAFICFLTPIAMGAVVIGGLLGANIASLATFTLFSNCVIALIAPYLLAEYGNGLCTFPQIMARVAPLLILPFLLAQISRALVRPFSDWVSNHSFISFYLWLVSLFVTLGRTTSYILNYDGEASTLEQISLAGVALLACVIQFALGRVIGHRYGDAVVGGQGLGQKNTVLAVWLAHSFLTPISSVAPTTYIIWQNIANSLQLYIHDRKANKKSQ